MMTTSKVWLQTIVPNSTEEWYGLLLEVLMYSFVLVALLCVGLVCCCMRDLLTGVGQIAQTLEEEQPTCFNYLVAARERALAVKLGRAKLNGRQGVIQLLKTQLNLLPEYMLVVRALEELAARKVKQKPARNAAFLETSQTNEELVASVTQNVRFLGAQGVAELEQETKSRSNGIKKQLLELGVSLFKRQVLPLISPKPRVGIPRELSPQRLQELLINYAHFLA
jgi:hypothetical protein